VYTAPGASFTDPEARRTLHNITYQ